MPKLQPSRKAFFIGMRQKQCQFPQLFTGRHFGPLCQVPSYNCGLMKIAHLNGDIRAKKLEQPLSAIAND